MTIFRIILSVLSLVALVFSFLWFLDNPDFEPFLAIVGSLTIMLTTIFEKKLRLIYFLKIFRRQNPQIGQNIRLVAFDADGVLLVRRKFMYSWQLVWEYLDLPDNVRKELLHRYRDLQEITYSEWCAECERIFKERNLSRDDFEVITAKVKQIRNLELAINKLKSHGIKTAIISGGIDVFLQYVIPNYQDLFDYVYINKMSFDAQQKIDTITPTLFDFKRKYNALIAIGEAESMRLNQMAFVGEGMNDFDAMLEMKNSGVTLFSVKPHDPKILDIAYVVNSYNLMKVVEPIIKGIQRNR